MVCHDGCGQMILDRHQLGVTWSTSKLFTPVAASIASRERETTRVVLWHYVLTEYILHTSVQLEI